MISKKTKTWLVTRTWRISAKTVDEAIDKSKDWNHFILKARLE